MNQLPELTRKQRARFDACLPLVTSEGCWEWEGYKSKAGYPMFSLGQKQFYGHRIMYMIHYDKDPYPLHVCHTCDNPGCVNPEHLFLGTDSDNISDKQDKDRDYSEKIYCNSDFTEETILAIRASNSTNVSLACQYGVSDGTISMIKSGKIHQRVGGNVGPSTRNQPKLSELDVREIRVSHDSMRSLANRYGVDKAIISRVQKGQSYLDIPWTEHELTFKKSGAQSGGRKGMTFTPEQLVLIEGPRPAKHIAEEVGCHFRTITKYRNEHGITKPRGHQFTDEQIELLKDLTISYSELARRLGVTGSTVASKRLALKKAGP